MSMSNLKDKTDDLRARCLGLIEDTIAAYIKGEISVEVRSEIIKGCHDSLKEISGLKNEHDKG